MLLVVRPAVPVVVLEAQPLEPLVGVVEMLVLTAVPEIRRDQNQD